MKKVKLGLSLTLFLFTLLSILVAIGESVAAERNMDFVFAGFTLIPAVLLMQSYRKSRDKSHTPHATDSEDSENETTLEESVSATRSSSVNNNTGMESIEPGDGEKTETRPGGTKHSRRIPKAELNFYKHVYERAINFINSQPASDFWSDLSVKIATRLVGSDDGTSETKTQSFWTTKKKAVLFLVLSLFSFTSIFDLAINYLPITGNIMSGANEYLDSTTKHALETFGVLRTVNAGISVLKDSKVDAEPAGIGITAAAGEVLQPAEDIVEQASTIVLVSATSLGIQKILIKIGGWIGTRMLLGLAFIILLVGVCILHNIDVTRTGVTLILISILIKLVLPLTDFAVKIISDEFLQHEYQQAFSQIHKANVDENVIDSEISQNKSSGIWGTIKGAVHSVGSKINLKERITTLKNWAAGAVDYVLTLIIVFLLQTIIFPLLFLFVLIRFMKSMFQPHNNQNLVSKANGKNKISNCSNVQTAGNMEG